MARLRREGKGGVHALRPNGSSSVGSPESPSAPAAAEQAEGAEGEEGAGGGLGQEWPGTNAAGLPERGPGGWGLREVAGRVSGGGGGGEAGRGRRGRAAAAAAQA